MNTKTNRITTPRKNPEVKYDEMIKFPGIYKILEDDYDQFRIIVNRVNNILVVDLEQDKIEFYFPSTWHSLTFIKLIDEEIQVVFTC